MNSIQKQTVLGLNQLHHLLVYNCSNVLNLSATYFLHLQKWELHQHLLLSLGCCEV